jgi:DNA-binding NarL/FixJ family response regulator
MDTTVASKIVLADDHPLFREALKQVITQRLKETQVVEAGSFAEVQSVLKSDADADLLLLDLYMPGSHGFSTLTYIRHRYPELPVLVITASDSHIIVSRSLGHGASGFVSKSASMDELFDAIRAVLNGDIVTPINYSASEAENEEELGEISERLAQLTPQQFRVLMMIKDGLLNKQIAYELAISEATIKAHVSAILRKLGVINRTQAVTLAQQLDIVDPANSHALADFPSHAATPK